MRAVLALVLLGSIVCPPRVVAAQARPVSGALPATASAESLPQRPVFDEAAIRGATRSVLSPGRAKGRQAGQPGQDRTWIQRHPVLFGALVGAGVGAVSSANRGNELYCASGGDEDCLFHGGYGVLFGAGAGAGIGALIVYLVGR